MKETTDPSIINSAIIAAIKGSDIPQIDQQKIIEVFGPSASGALSAQVVALVQEATRMPIEWGDMTLEQGVNDILRRFHELHPEISPEALHEIGRCVAWHLR